MADESWSDDGWDGNAAAILPPDESWGYEGWPDGSWSEDGFPAPAPTSNDVVQNGGRDARDGEMKMQNSKQVRSVINLLSNIYLCTRYYLWFLLLINNCEAQDLSRFLVSPPTPPFCLKLKIWQK